MKKILSLAMMSLALFTAACNNDTKPNEENNEQEKPEQIVEVKRDKSYNAQGASGYILDEMKDFKKYENTEAHKVVTNAAEFLEAIKNARYDYSREVTNVLETGQYVVRNNVGNTTNWARATEKGLYVKNSDGTFTKLASDEPFSTYKAGTLYYEDSPLVEVEYTQTLNKEGSVHIIELANDIDLGYKKIDFLTLAEYQDIVKSFGKATSEANFTMSSMYKESGISQIAIERTNNLLIYSKNGSKITHAGFKINYCNNVAIRNVEFDELWQWEDSSKTTTASVGDYDAFGWAYFKIGFSDNIWIDHCTFGKSYDGQIDVSNPTQNTFGTSFYAPYEGDGKSNVHISWCEFNAGSSDKSGYLYKMMEEIENDYKNNGGNYLYYKALRDKGLTFEDILYGIAIPQKKGFLLCDSGDEYKYNLNLKISIAYNKFKNIEDRIPKIRGGICYFYNNVVDSSEYYEYRTKLKSLNANSYVASVSPSWKLALVSQGIVCGNGGSVGCDTVIFRGIDSLLKNNDSSMKNDYKLATATYNGGYKIINSSYQLGKNDPIITDSTLMPNSTTTSLKEEYFNYHTDDNKLSFTPYLYSLEELEDVVNNLDYKSGVINNDTFDFLLTKYN